MFVDPCIILQFIKKNPTRCNNVSEFYYSIFIWSSTCFGRHTAQQQEPKTALAASSFAYVEGCWTCSWWIFSGTVSPVPDNAHQLHVQQTSTYKKPEPASAVLGSWWWAVSTETCWTSYKYGIIKFWYIVASCWIFLYELNQSVWEKVKGLKVNLVCIHSNH